MANEPMTIGTLTISPEDLRAAADEVQRAGSAVKDAGAKANQGAARLQRGQLGIVFGDVFEPCVNGLFDLLAKAIQSTGEVVEQSGHALTKIADAIEHQETIIADSLDLFK